MTETLTLPKGRYLITAHTPLTNPNQPVLNSDFQFCLKINGSLNDEAYRIFNRQYGVCDWIIELTAQSTIALASGQGASITWPNQYISRGGLDAILLSHISPIIYSTDEMEVGTWIDNSILYQKTVSSGGSVPSGATLRERITQVGYDTIRYTK